MSEIDRDEMAPLGCPDAPEDDQCPCDLCMGYGDEGPEPPFFPEPAPTAPQGAACDG